MPPRVKGLKQRRRHFIREWREFRHLTQAQLAERLEMSEASLSRIETNKQPYTQDFLESCAVALQTEPAHLIMRRPDERRPDEEEIFSLWERADSAEREQIAHFAGFLLNRSRNAS